MIHDPNGEFMLSQVCLSCGHPHIEVNEDGDVIKKGRCVEYDPSIILEVLREKETIYIDQDGALERRIY